MGRRTSGRGKPGASSQALGTVHMIPGIQAHGYRLRNGLEVWLLPDASVPVVSYQTWFRVGSADEMRGKTGLAHLLEHLMFKSTENRSQGEFDRTVESCGGETNAATWTDFTFYHDEIPYTELDTVMALEADRMSHLRLDEAQVASEKDVVANERRLTVDNDVDGAAREALYALAFGAHPYGWPTIGSMEDIEGFTVKDCEDFYVRNYSPNNAVVVIAGRFSVGEALRGLDVHYGDKPAVVHGARAKRGAKPISGSRAERIKLPTHTERLLLGYHCHPGAHRMHATWLVLNELWFGGRSGRMFRHLVRETEAAVDADGFVTPFRQTGLFEICADAREGVSASRLLALMDEQMEATVNEDLDGETLERAKHRLELSHTVGFETAHGRAEEMGFMAAALDSPHLTSERMAQVRAVTARDVRKLVWDRLLARGRAVVMVTPS